MSIIAKLMHIQKKTPLVLLPQQRALNEMLSLKKEILHYCEQLSENIR